ncbi:MAG: cobaltochelatase subunit CobN, partial [Actinomycetota bacterium]|nr:cobaltochelatase subunit CobN [Actinomycetota bacterium]
LLLSTADTDLLAARAVDDPALPLRLANPARLDGPVILDGVALVVVRLLGGRRAWDGLDALLADAATRRVPVVALGGEGSVDAELTTLSTVPPGVVADAAAYLREGGTANLRELVAFLSDTVLLTGHGFAPPATLPLHGVHGRRPLDPTRPTVGVVFYRAHALSGNTAFVDVLCDAVEARGANALPVYVGSLRPDADGRVGAVEELLTGRVDALVVTVLAGGGSGAADAEGWDARALAALDVPVLQGLCVTSSRAAWEASDAGLAPIDAAMQVAIPEFDGRLVGPPFSFKEEGPDGVPTYVADPERAARVAGVAVAHARLRSVPPADKKIALVLSSYPTKHSRVGNAVGLDTPASAVRLLQALRDTGHTVGDPVGGGTGSTFPEDGDELIHTLIAAGGHDVEWLTEEQLRAAVARVPLADYEDWFATLPEDLRERMVAHWGPPPGSLYVDDGQIVLAALQYGNVVLMIQPPRGFGENPIAIYHDPDLPPSHHYLAAYRWLESSFGAHAVVHVGKHGTLEWLPGKGLGLSASCAPDAVLGDLPLFYPFIVNDPGEGTQAKRRAHATVVDHLVPPMARAESYDETAQLEQLLDEYAQVQALDPAKLPALRAQIWELVTAAQLHRDLHVEAAPADEEFDDFLLHVDGYLCEVKDVLIRDGLHVLGQPPSGPALVDLVLGVLRAEQTWGGETGALPGLRRALAAEHGLVEDGSTAATDRLEELARGLVEALADAGWDPAAVDGLSADAAVRAVLRFACTEVVPRLARTTDELDHLLHGLAGGFVPAGPSGSPTRGLVGVLPTGRNFYSVDPKAIPSRSAWAVGQALGDSLLERYRADHDGEHCASVGLVVWGTSAMRTSGDDIAEALWLLGVRPVWDAASRRVTDLELVPRAELGRPRVDVTLRISGFFRDAFPHVVALLDDAVQLAASASDEEDNALARHVAADVAAGADVRAATARIFGSKPAAYGAGLLPLIDSRDWKTDADLAEVWAVWGGYAYGRGLDGAAARADMERVYTRVQVAAKNQDTREHDLVDSDDYFQYHGGMVAAVRALTGASPEAYVGDSAVPDSVRTRTLGEETARVFRARVVNPRWMAAMRRHGYKGAFEMAATVDYLFGYDATAGVVEDWMYEKVTSAYVFDEQNRAFMQQSNPWALRGIAERLLEAAERGLWESPSPEALEGLTSTYLQLEGDLEGGADDGGDEG